MRLALSTMAHVAVLTIVIPLLLLQFAVGNTSVSVVSSDPLLYALGVLITLISVVRIVALARDFPESAIALTFYIFIYIWCGIVPIFQISVGVLPWRVPIEVEYLYTAYALILISIFSFELGYQVFRGARLPKASNLASCRIAVLSFCVIAVSLALWLGPLTTSFSALIGTREDVDAILGSDYDRLVRAAVMRTPVYVGLLAIIWCIRTSNNFRTPGTYLVAAATAAVFLLVNFPTSVSRAWFGATTISIALVFFLTSSKWRGRYFPMLLVFGLLTVYPIFDQFRSRDYSERGVTVTSTYVSGDFDVYVMTAHFARYVDLYRETAPYGRQLLGSTLFWVPRSMWSDKPTGSGHMVSELSGFRFHNVSAPLWAEGLINFGWAGVVLFLFALGSISRSLSRRGGESSAATIRGLCYVYFAGFLIMILRGDLMTVFGFIAPFIICVVGIATAVHLERLAHKTVLGKRF